MFFRGVIVSIAYKCKCCAANLDVEEGMRLVKCPACRTKQTLPSSRDENIQNLFNRATTLRLKSEFDKAESVYERIIQADEEQYEAYWGLILCKFGVEYVEDPKTETRIPTCHRTSYESIIADENYKLALKYALDDYQKALYTEEAQEIDKIQKGILEVAQNEEPYDVFICYKETDENGKRTQDSVIANDIYHQLTQEGFKVFYAAITLEGKLGSAYEPIIFAALNSAKVMLAIGTKPEYFNAVWVKNEWSRFLKITKDSKNKTIIPCYKGMDPYDLPDEFAHLQAQDMGKIGFITDLIRGVKKVLEKSEEKPTTVVVNASVNPQIENLIKRARLAVEDGEFNKARNFVEQALNIDVEYAEAYMVDLFCDFNAKNLQELGDKCTLTKLEENVNYKKALRFADGDLKTELENISKYLRLKQIKTLPFMEQHDYERVKRQLEDLSGFKPAEEYFANLDKVRNQQLAQKVRSFIKRGAYAIDYYLQRITDEELKLELVNFKNQIIYNKAKECKAKKEYATAKASFSMIKGYKDAESQAAECDRLEKQRKQEEQRQQQMALWREQKLCQHCGGNFKGLFKKVCTCCGTQKDY